MTQGTIHYRLPIHSYGETYSAAAESSRFTVIDQLLYSVSSISGEGKIEGWEISPTTESAPSSLVVAPGIGMISQRISRTFGDLSIDLPQIEGIYNLYMQRKSAYVAKFSAYSEMQSILNVDTTAPLAPSSISTSGVTATSAVVTWSAVSAPDLNRYILERSTDSFVFDVQIITTTEQITYTDTSLSENTSYEYRVKAVDKSDNESPYVTSAGFTTLLDLTVPTNPSFLFTLPSDGFIQFVWDHPAIGNIQTFELRVYSLDGSFNIVALLNTVTTGGTSDSIKIENLNNGETYRFILYAVSTNNQYSSGISVDSTPVVNKGPAEILNLSVAEVEDQTTTTWEKLNITWLPGVDPYKSLPDYYEVYVVENGTDISDPILAYSNSLSVKSFDVGGIPRPISARTKYLIFVKAVDAQGQTNNGVISSILTTNFKAPAPPSSLLATDMDDGSILFSWTNSGNIFEKNWVTIRERDVDTDTTTVLFGPSSYGTGNSYVIEETKVTDGNEYSIYIKAEDEFGNESSLVTSTHLVEETAFDEIFVPPNQRTLAGYSEIGVFWNIPTNPRPNGFKIFRADYSPSGVLAADFSLLAEVPGTSGYFVDYTADSDGRYYYLVTIVDVRGNESLNPIDDGYFFYPLVFGYSISDSSLSAPSGVAVSALGSYDVLLTWDELFGAFDGYEIYRSDGDILSWTKVGDAPRDTTEFLDEDARLTDNTTYYYMIRKYRNEARLVLQGQSEDAPLNSIQLARITLDSGSLSVDSSPSDSLQNGLAEEIENRIDEHIHSYSTVVDRRINLARSVTVTAWTTTDNRTYTTQEDISGASEYLVEINGFSTSILYEVDSTAGTITFNQEVSLTELAVECVSLDETSGELPFAQVEEINATQIEWGELSKELFPLMSHSGREKEDLIPLQLPMETENGFSYTIKENEIQSGAETIGSSIAFYDIVSLPSTGELLAATSKGIMKGTSNGFAWEMASATDLPVFRMGYDSTSGTYLAGGAGFVLFSVDGTAWVRASGLEGASIVRDFAFDGAGVAFTSTDVGVFYIDLTLADYAWNETTIQDVRAIDSFGLLYDSVNSILLVGTELGLFQTADNGTTWSYASGFAYRRAARSFALLSTVFLFITKNQLFSYNPTSGTYEWLYTSEFELYDIVILDSRVILLTDGGLLISSDGQDFLTGTEFTFHQLSTGVALGRGNPLPNCACVISDSLHLGFEGRYLFGDLDGLALMYSDSGDSVSPTFYENGERKDLGVFYHIASNSACVYQRMLEDDSLSVANQYSVYRAKYGGWIGQNYQASISIKQNQTEIGTASGPTAPPVSILRNSVFTTFTESNSVKDLADSYETQFAAAIERLNGAYNGSVTVESWETISSIAAETMRLYYKAHSCLIGKPRPYYTYTEDSVAYTNVGFEKTRTSNASSIFTENVLYAYLPMLESASSGIFSADESSGVIVFSSSKNKYDDMTIDISGVSLENDGTNTHQEIDDALEIKNAFLPAQMASLYEANLLKTGMFLVDQTGVGPELKTTSSCNLQRTSTTQAEYIDLSVANSYDVFNSTVDYELQSGGDEITFGIDYPYAVHYSSSLGKVFVGGSEGCLLIDTTTYEMTRGEFSDDIAAVVGLFEESGTIYLVTKTYLFSTTDGISWTQIPLMGVEGDCLGGVIYKERQIIFTDRGIYRKSAYTSIWSQVSTITPISVVSSGNQLFAEANGNLYTSATGASWRIVDDFSGIEVNAFSQFQGAFVVGTSSGLRLDNATFNSAEVNLSLIDVEGDITASTALIFNDVAVTAAEDKFIAGTSNSAYYEFDGSVYNKYENSHLDAIHKVLYIGDEYWLFGYDRVLFFGEVHPKKMAIGIDF